MVITKKYSRRDFNLLARNVLAIGGLASVIPNVLAADTAAMRLGHFNNATPQTFEKITGSLQSELGVPKVTFHALQSAPEFISAMVSGALDTCSIASSPFITTVANKLDFSLVYLQREITSSEGLIIRKNSDIKTASDLRGKRIGVPFNTSSHLGLLATLKEANIAATDVHLINLKPDALASAWASKSLDAAFVWHPVMGQLVKDDGVVVTIIGDLKSQDLIMFDGIIVTNEFKAKHPDLLLKYLRDFNRTTKLYKNEQAKLITAFSDYLRLSPELTRQYVETFQPITPREMVTPQWLGTPGDRDSGVIRSLKLQADFLVEAGQIKKGNLDFAQHIDSSFALQLALEDI
ncbi:PhnD/SsuA/transferrin family substrate-binding protein [Pseudomonas sp. WHRI 8519]|uniref:taurine ABC transporter substrate-binding protein n=1 Tax=Pseudomonas sp. WHRI 8519 TaxID=3162567 RepID=UPI0032EECE81